MNKENNDNILIIPNWMYTKGVQNELQFLRNGGTYTSVTGPFGIKSYLRSGTTRRVKTDVVEKLLAIGVLEPGAIDDKSKKKPININNTN